MEKKLEKRVKELERKDDFIYKCIDSLSDIADVQCRIAKEHNQMINDLYDKLGHNTICVCGFIILVWVIVILNLLF